jgi:general secretion pathway protein K
MDIPAAGLKSTQVPAGGRQRGVALVTALLVVSLATVAAVAMATRLQVDVRRTGNLLHGEQAYAYALAAESWAEVILRRDANDSKIDTLAEDWATALPPIAVEGGFVNGHIEDLQGRFNVNNLVGADGKPSVPDLEYFKRLLGVLEIEPGLATALLDWIDADINATYPDGAEDDVYLLETPPYRAANRPLVSISELRLVKGYSAEIIALLEPYITALPEPTAINVNTASPVVLQALHAELGPMDAEQIIAARGDDGFPELGAFMALDALAGLQLDVDVDIKSDWFSVLTDVHIGRGQARLDSRLQRSGNVLTVGYRVRTRRLLP